MLFQHCEKVSAEFVTEFGATPNSSLNSVQNSALFPSPAGIAHIPRKAGMWKKCEKCLTQIDLRYS